MAHVWPIDSPPCDATSTLQECVDGANSGDAVKIATNGPISESISFEKSLTLGAAQGFTPVFSAGNVIKAILTNTDSTSIRIEGLTLQDGYIYVVQEGSGSLTVDIVNNLIEQDTTPTDGGFGGPVFEAIGIQAITAGAATGPMSFFVAGNTVSFPVVPPLCGGSPCTAEGISIFSNASSSSGLVTGNILTMSLAGSTAIDLSSLSADLTVDVTRNHISGIGYDAGIELFSEGTGTLTARVLDNLVSGEHSSQGDGAITADASSDPLGGTGAIQFAIANNTIARDDTAIRVRRERGPQGQLGTVAGSIANNALTGNFYGLDVDPALVGTVSDHSNLFFDNTADVASGIVGLNSILADPLYDGSTDYHLKSGSPAIDAGDDSAVPATDLEGNPITDLDGHPRVQGAHVDIGVYETAPEPDAQTLAVSALVTLLGVMGRGTATPGGRK
ncbi:MAG TPA: choice-of-anchor Q domain-containing protein [Myxococcota bacterium]|nr:choice-of-anchor Q domain-containing protein [Myxococcota bacterium]